MIGLFVDEKVVTRVDYFLVVVDEIDEEVEILRIPYESTEWKFVIVMNVRHNCFSFQEVDVCLVEWVVLEVRVE